MTADNGHSLCCLVPYRIDVIQPRDDALDRLVQLGALDVEPLDDEQLAAILPDSIAADAVARALGGARVRVSPAAGQDDGSVWAIRSLSRADRRCAGGASRRFRPGRRAASDRLDRIWERPASNHGAVPGGD